jgi:hypothetical protein
MVGPIMPTIVVVVGSRARAEFRSERREWERQRQKLRHRDGQNFGLLTAQSAANSRP